MKNLVFLLIMCFLVACSETKTVEMKLGSVDLIDIPGAKAKLAVVQNDQGTILEKGILESGSKTGMWISYHDNNRIKTIGSYVNGKLNGPYYEFNNRGQLEYEANYLNEQFHGMVARYKFGRPEQELNYRNGDLDGPFAEYSNRGKLKKKGAFKNGKQHGTLQFFDDDEKLIMQYEYKDGEKISGGIVETEE